ncbi:MAG: hypothetical protein AAF648_11645 [Pseudomonadota bacterium]
MTRRSDLSHRRLALLALLILTQTACVTATVQAVRETSTGMTSGDSIVVLGRRSRPNSNETEFNFVNCVNRKVSSGTNAIGVVDEQRFRDALFPWFEPRTAPGQASDLSELIAQPALAERFNDIGLRYVVWVEGSTQRIDQGGSLSCTVTPGSAGCFGFLTWENDSSYEAQIWDVRSGRQAGKVSSEANGTSYLPALVVPIPMIARVQLGACNSLSNQLKTFLQDS